MKKLGFIGAGNMAAAIIGGMINAGVAVHSDIITSDADVARLEFIAQKYRVETTQSNIEVAQTSDIIFLSVKPYIYDAVISEIRGVTKTDALVIILAGGVSIAAARTKFNTDVKLIKTMPNTPAMVNCGMTAICAAENVTPDELEPILEIFNSIGKTEILPERLFDVFTALAGSSPAYAFMFIEAMADAGVKHGLSRKQAIEISTQALLGAAKLLQETGEHPATLRDAVCTPGGTTIAAVCEFEAKGFRNAIISAVDACTNKYNKLQECH
ncbi:MAG: pyrroline-5-carboxylate reductase [Defluviitaleaceae bacterium]|nr:pyrroline-5-carboxylate reductase [Defluviitaleaceae bacterium]